ncbi:MAG: TetR/AcrR family transcriptional regulator [Cyanobacteria bacterium P01_G01_bin.54]
MPATKTDVVPKLVSVFRQYGYEGATLSRISTATGLGRASLYHHFPQGKQGMAAAVLEHISETFRELVLAPLQTQAEPIARLMAMSQGLAQFYDQGRRACFLDIFSLGEAGELFQTRNQRAIQAWIAAIAQVLQEAGLPAAIAEHRAQEAVMQIQGGLIVARLGNAAPFLRILAALPQRLLAPIV